MRKFDGWTTTLFALVFIAAPALVGYYFLLKDWGYNYYYTGTSGPTFKAAKIVLSTGTMWGVAIGFIAYVFVFTGILVLTKILTIDSITFIIPITLVFAAIFLTSGIAIWGRGLIVVGIVLCAFPINILVSNMKNWQIRKSRQ